MQCAALAVLLARKKPFLLSLMAKCGPVSVLRVVIDRYESSETAQNDMYRYFAQVNAYVDGKLMSDCLVHDLMVVTEKQFGDCVFSIVVEKLEI
jgi:hypothetical protein